LLGVRPRPLLGLTSGLLVLTAGVGLYVYVQYVLTLSASTPCKKKFFNIRMCTISSVLDASYNIVHCWNAGERVSKRASERERERERKGERERERERERKKSGCWNFLYAFAVRGKVATKP